MDKNKSSEKILRATIAIVIFAATGYYFYLWLLKKDLNSYYPQYKHKNDVNILVMDGILAPSAIQAMQDILKVNLNVKVLNSEQQLLEELKNADTKYDLVQIPADFNDLSQHFVELQATKIQTLKALSEDLKSPLINEAKLYSVPILWGFYFVTPNMLNAKNLLFEGSTSHYNQLIKNLPELNKMTLKDPLAKVDPTSMMLKINQTNDLAQLGEIKSAALFAVHFGLKQNSLSKEVSYKVLQLLLDENIALKNALGSKLGALHSSAEFQGLEAYQKPSFLRNVPLTQIMVLN